MNNDFIRNRITALRLQKGVSEYRMSYDLGRSRGYVHNISSGKTLPSMSEFLAICEYFSITPSEFFDEQLENPILLNETILRMDQLGENDLALILNIVNRILQVD